MPIIMVLSLKVLLSVAFVVYDIDVFEYKKPRSSEEDVVRSSELNFRVGLYQEPEK